MTQQPDRSSKAAVNLDELLTRVDNDYDLLSELIGIFKEEFPRLLQSLQRAVACEDLKNVETTSHTLKGMLSGLSVTRASAIASRMEQMARAGEKLKLAGEMTLFEHEVADLFPELDAYTAEAKS
jgi:HPt (histidine-containing phosphotransfer) domain-containing protein